MNLDAILIVNGEETHPEAPGFLSRTQAAFNAYKQQLTFIVTPTRISERYLLFNGVKNEYLIPEYEEFRHFLTGLGADTKHYTRKNSCDEYTSMLFGIHASNALLENDRLGLATDANLVAAHTELAEAITSAEIVALPSEHSVPQIEEVGSLNHTAALKMDFSTFGVGNDNISSHREILRRHPEIAQCYGEVPRGSYSMLRSLEKSFK